MLRTNLFAMLLKSLRNGVSNRQRRRNRSTSCEILEHRTVLSSISVSGNSVIYDAAAGETNNLTISESGGTLTFRDTGAAIVAGSGPFTIVSPNEITLPVAGISILNVSLGDLNDTLDGSGIGVGSGITNGLFSGGEGNDILTGTQVTDSFGAFDIQPGSDTIDGLGELPGQRDTIRINSDLDVTATDTSMAIGTSVSTYVNLEFIAINGGASDNMINASGITSAGSFTSVQINAGDGNDTILGSQIADSVTISGVNPGVDSMNLGGQQAGRSDSVRISVDLDVTISDTALTIAGSTATHLNVERVVVDGGSSDNVIDLSGITAGGTITGTQINAGDGDDTITGSQLADIIVVSGSNPGSDTIDGRAQPTGQRDTLFVNVDDDISMTNSVLQIGLNIGSQTNMEGLSINGGVSNNIIDLSGIDSSGTFEFIQVEGGAGNDTITGSQLADRIIVSGLNTGSDIIDAQANTNGNDSLFLSADADIEVTDTTFTIAGTTSTFAAFEVTSLRGGNGDNTFDVRSLTTSGGHSQIFMNGEGGSDTFITGSLGIQYTLLGETGIDTLDLRHATISPGVNITGPGPLDGNNGSFGGSSSFTNINDIILPPEYEFSAPAYSAVEGNSPNTVSIVEVTRTVNTTIASSVEVVLSDGSATSGSDYAAGPVVVSFQPGEVTKSVPITLIGDTAVEPDETIDLSLTGGIAGPGISTAVFTIINDDVDNQSPEVLSVETDASFASKASPGDIVTLTAVFTDADSGDSHTAIIDWGDGTVSGGVVDEQTGTVTGTHDYTTGGIFEVTVTVSDSSAASDAAATIVVVTGVRLTDDGALQIVGTNRRDHIDIGLRQGGTTMAVRLHTDHGHHHGHHHGHGTGHGHHGHSHHSHGGHGHHGHGHHADPESFQFAAEDVSSILIYACDGDDHVHVSSHISVDATIYAGAGNDHVHGGSGNDILIGGSGNDHLNGNDGHDIVQGGSGWDLLKGGAGRDLLIGGSGRDYMLAQQGEDILIGALTEYGDDVDALAQIRAVWIANNTFADRVTALSADLLAPGKVIDDDTRDWLIGHHDADWYFADPNGFDRDLLPCFDSDEDELSHIF
jgi:hypothetical protein